jgi:hypothetical protein
MRSERIIVGRDDFPRPRSVRAECIGDRASCLRQSDGAQNAQPLPSRSQSTLRNRADSAAAFSFWTTKLL